MGKYFYFFVFQLFVGCLPASNPKATPNSYEFVESQSTATQTKPKESKERNNSGSVSSSPAFIFVNPNLIVTPESYGFLENQSTATQAKPQEFKEQNNSVSISSSPAISIVDPNSNAICSGTNENGELDRCKWAAIAYQQRTLLNLEPIQVIYRQMLGREANPSDLQYHVNLLLQSTTLDLEINFKNSDEYKNNGAKSSEDIIALYRTLLSRFPSVAELANGVNSYKSGTPLSQLATIIRGSEQINLAPVQEIYNNILGRAVAGSDLVWVDSWAKKIATGEVAFSDLKQIFRGCDEYINRGNRAGEVTGVLYQVILKRFVDEVGLKYWSTLLQQTQFPWLAAHRLMSTKEFRMQHPTLVNTCPEIEPYRNQPTKDASIVIQKCIHETPALGFLMLPAGTYGIFLGPAVDRPIKLMTQGLETHDPTCVDANAFLCVQLVSIPERVVDGVPVENGGKLLQINNDFAGVDHIIMDGNRPNRIVQNNNNRCTSQNTMSNNCSNCSLTSSSVVNAMCANGAAFMPGHNIEVSHNFIARNGRHADFDGSWADGLTLFQGDHSFVFKNTFVDNTDIDLVTGGGINLKVWGNTILHSTDFGGSAFAALQIQSWPKGAGAVSTSGDYTGADIASNFIDCGGSTNCGFGLQIGAAPWYNAVVHGGSVHDNTIINAQQGLDIAHFGGVVRVFNNNVSMPAFNADGYRSSNLIFEKTSAYNVWPASVSLVDFSLDSIPQSSYTRRSFGILNWWKIK